MMLISGFMHLFMQIINVFKNLNAKHCGNICVVRTTFGVTKLKTAIHTEMTRKAKGLEK